MPGVALTPFNSPSPRIKVWEREKVRMADYFQRCKGFLRWSVSCKGGKRSDRLATIQPIQQHKNFQIPHGGTDATKDVF